jgi:hypothetical protein
MCSDIIQFEKFIIMKACEQKNIHSDFFNTNLFLVFSFFYSNIILTSY